VRRPSLGDHVDWTGMDPGQRAAWVAAYDQHYRAATPILQMTCEDNPFNLLRCVLEGLTVLPEHATLREQGEKALAAFESGVATGQARVILGQIDAVAGEFPQSGIPWMVKALALQSVGDASGAVASAETALNLARAAGDEQLVQKIERDLRSFDAGRRPGQQASMPGSR